MSDPAVSPNEAAFVTFYSFKGGVGRTMALANVACILAGRGRRVLCIDMDLEAPGLTYLAQREREAATGDAKLDAPGFVDLIDDFLRKKDKSPIANLDKPDSFLEYTVEMPIPEALKGENSGGVLRIMPAGRISGYVSRLQSIRLGELYEEGIGKPILQHLKAQIIKSQLFDYVLVDSRTGFADEAGIAVRDLGTYLVMLMGLNRQNVEGAAQFLEHIKQKNVKPQKVVFVATPVPIGEDEMRVKRLKAAHARLRQAWDDKAQISETLPYHPRVALDENPFIHEWPDSPLAAAYRRLEGRVRELAGDTEDAWMERAQEFALQGMPEMAMSALKELRRFNRQLAALVTGAVAGALLNRAVALAEAGKVMEALAQLTGVLSIDGISVSSKAQVLYNRGVAYEELKKSAEAIADYTTVVTLPNAPADQKAQAFVNRGVAYRNIEKVTEAIADFTAVLAMSDASAEPKAQALVNRGITYGKMKKNAEAISDYTAVLAMHDAPTEPKSQALINRGAAYGKMEKIAEAIADFEVVLAMPDAPTEQKAQALINRGVAYEKIMRAAEAIAEYSAVLAMPDARVEQKAQALVNRGAAYGNMKKIAEAMTDFDVVLATPDAPAEQKAHALVNRGVSYGKMKRSAEAIADYTAVLTMPDAPAEHKAQALINRGGTYGKMKKEMEAIADFTVVLSMPDALAEQRAQALLSRGVAYGQMNMPAEESADYDAVLASPDTSAAQKAMALSNLAWTSYLKNDLATALSKAEESCNLDANNLTNAFNLALFKTITSQETDAGSLFGKVISQWPNKALLQTVFEDIESAITKYPNRRHVLLRAQELVRAALAKSELPTE